ncbi:MAG: hypothetical protein ACNA8W_13705, partial [Bradymonadaceae bacterium]
MALLARWFLVLILGLILTMGCTDDPAAPVSPANNVPESDTGEPPPITPPETDACSVDCEEEPPPVEDCHPLLDEDCACRVGHARLCSSHGDPQSFGPTSPCRAGV